MYLLGTVTRWDDKRRVAPLDSGAREFILNPSRMIEIKANGTGSKMRFTLKHDDTRESSSYMELDDSVAEIKTAYDVPSSKTITLPVYKKNDPTKGIYYITIPSDALIYADRYNPSPTESSWVLFEEGTFKIGTNIALVPLSLEEILSTSSMLKDYDGNGYTTVTIGTQEWIVEPLIVEHYSDGSDIVNIEDEMLWVLDATGGFCYYENDSVNKATLGILYNWYAVDNKAGLAYFKRNGIQEVGWRVPTQTDWLQLIGEVGGALVAGGKLKQIGTSYWEDPNVDATDEYGWRGISGGNRFIDTALNEGFSGSKIYGDYWSATADPDDITVAFSYWLGSGTGVIWQGDFGKLCGQNVRCVRDI
jgi:uncharacterized protein (TIGR02145 family)